MQQRTIFSIIIGVAILSLSLFLLNTWLNTKNEGMFLTQDTYVGTVTWYEDAMTPPTPSELKKSSPLTTPLAENTPTTSTNNSELIPPLDISTAAGPIDSTPLFEPEIYDVATGKFIKAPPQQNVSLSTPQSQTTPPVSAPQQNTSPSPSASISTKSKESAKATKSTVPATLSKDIISPSTQKSVKKIFLTKDPRRPLRIEASHPITYKTFYLASPERVVIDIDGKLNISSIEKSITKHPTIKDVRIAYNGKNTRIVVDLLKKPKEWAVVYGQRKSTVDVSLRY